MVNGANWWESSAAYDSTGPQVAPAPVQTTDLQRILDAPEPQSAPPLQPARASSVVPTQGDNLLPDNLGLQIWSGYNQEIPNVPTDKGFFEKTWGTVTDIVGTPIDKVGDILSYPSDRLEQVAGLFYWNDVPDWGTRWEMGAMTWEMLGPDKGKLREDTKRVFTTGSDQEIEAFMQEHEGGISDMVMKFFADPLNILGVPFLGIAANGLKGLGVADEALLPLRLLNRGLTPNAVESLGLRLPQGARPISDGIASFMRKTGLGADYHADLAKRTQEMWLRRMTDAEYEVYQAGLRLRPPTGVRALVSQTPRWKANDRYVAGLTASQEFINSAPHHFQVQAFWDALGNRDYKALSAITGNPHWEAPVMRDFVNAVGDEMVYAKKLPAAFKSYNVRPDDPQMVKDLILRSKDPADVLDPGKAFMHWQTQFMRDLQDVAEPGVDHWFGMGGKLAETEPGHWTFVPSEPDDIERAITGLNRFHAGVKRLMGITYLNRPAFTIMNILSNHFHVAFDGFGGFGGFKLSKDLMREYGLNPQTVTLAARDAQHLAEAMGLTGAAKRVWLTMAPWVQLASKNDAAARVFVEFKATMRNMDSLMQFADDSRALLKGTLPPIPRLEGAADHVVDGLKAKVAGIRSDSDLLALRRELTDGTYTHGAVSYLTRALKDEGFVTPNGQLSDEGILMLDGMIGPFTQRFDTMLEDLRSGRSDMLGLHDVVEQLNADNLSDLQRFRPLDRHSPYPTRIMRPDQLLARRVRMHELIQREQGDLGLGVSRWLKAKSYSGEQVRTVQDALQSYHETQNKALVAMFDTLDKRKVTWKAKDAADAKYLRERAAAKRELNKVVEKTLGERYDPNMPAAWRNFMKRDDDAAAALAKHRRETIGKVRALEDQFDQGVPKSLLTLEDKITKAQTRRTALRAEIDAAEAAAKPALEGKLGRLEKRIGVLESSRAGPMGDLYVQKAALWDQHDLFRDQLYSTTLDGILGDMRIRRLPRPTNVPGDMAPDVGEAATNLFDFRDKLLQRIAAYDDVPAVSALNPEHVAALTDYLNAIEPIYRENRSVALMAGRAAADFTMHNYEHTYGIDEIVKFLFPYHFWPTRTMWRWAQRTMAQPAATAAFAKLQDFQADADLPQRLQGKFRMPIPFLPDWMGGGIYFDPTRILFPFAEDIQSNEDVQGGLTGFTDWSSRLGMSFAPWVTLPLQFGDSILGGRTDHIQFQMSGLPWFVPGTKAQRAIYSFLVGQSEGDGITPEDLDTLTLGKAFPETQLRTILGLKPGDEWDAYRVLRMAANAAADGTLSPERALRAIKERVGPDWQLLKDRAATENGMRDLSSYALGVGGSIYPKGEQIQRGLKMILDTARTLDQGREHDDNTQAFFEAFPEYSVRQAANAWYNGKPEVDKEVDTSLYYIDLAQIHDKYDAQIEAWKKWPLSGKAELAYLYEQRSAEISNLDRMYSKRETRAGIYKPPTERALYALREEWYGIEGSNPQTRKAGQQLFLAKLNGPGLAAKKYLYTQEADAILQEYAQKRASTANQDDREALVKERDQKIEELTMRARRDISAQDFLDFLETSKQTPGERQIEAQRMSDALRQLFAKTRDRWPDVYKAYPGLASAYGTDPDPSLAGQLDALWAGYFALPPNSLARQDYIDMFHQDISAVRTKLGLPPIAPSEPDRGIPAPASAYEADPFSAALLDAQLAAGGVQ